MFFTFIIFIAINLLIIIFLGQKDCSWNIEYVNIRFFLYLS